MSLSCCTPAEKHQFRRLVIASSCQRNKGAARLITTFNTNRRSCRVRCGGNHLLEPSLSFFIILSASNELKRTAPCHRAGLQLGSRPALLLNCLNNQTDDFSNTIPQDDKILQRTIASQAVAFNENPGAQPSTSLLAAQLELPVEYHSKLPRFGDNNTSPFDSINCQNFLSSCLRSKQMQKLWVMHSTQELQEWNEHC